MIIIEEVLVANGMSVLMMLFLLYCRQKNRENIHTEDRLYDAMAIIDLLGAILETVSFLVDGKSIPGGRVINLISNSLCYLGTVTIALVWCLYTELRIYRNYRRARRHIGFLLIPWLIETAVILTNPVTGLLFTVSRDNVYERGGGALLGYLTLILYFGYSVFLVRRSERQGINLTFFPVLFFIGPCIVGVLSQLFCYGITTAWVSVAIALAFVQMQQYAENLYTDELSGLYNRRYLNGILAKRAQSDPVSLYGIMMDMDDFKSINDRFGHNAGDRAICAVGRVLFQTLPSDGVAVRYAGDEFVVLLFHANDDSVRSTIREIREGLARFNASGSEMFTLAASMGYARFGIEDDAEAFLNRMDQNMYREKRAHQRNAARQDL